MTISLFISRMRDMTALQFQILVEQNTQILAQVTQLTKRVDKIDTRLAMLEVSTPQQIKAMGETFLEAMSTPFQKLETDFQTTKKNHDKRLTRLKKRTA